MTRPSSYFVVFVQADPISSATCVACVPYHGLGFGFGFWTNFGADRMMRLCYGSDGGRLVWSGL
jgi:hypothetical protein